MQSTTRSLLAAAALVSIGCADPALEVAKAARPLGVSSRGGSVIVDRERFVAYAADSDNHAIHRVDLATSEVSSIAVDGVPEQLVFAGGGRIAVTLRDRNRVDLVAIDAGSASIVASALVPADPWGLALTPQGEILVTSAWGHAVTALDADTLEARWSADVAREPRAVVVSPDGRSAFVTHLVGDSITVLDLDDASPAPRRVRALGGLYRNRVDRAIGAGTVHPSAALAYAAVISEPGGKLFVPHLIEQNGASTTRVIPLAYGGVPVEEETSFSSVAVLAARTGKPLVDPTALAADETLEKAAFVAADSAVSFAVAPLPAPSRQARAAAILGDRLLVASFGTAELCELDARSIDPAMSVVRRYPVGEGPKGVDVDPIAGVAVVWSQLSHELSIVSLDTGAVTRLPIATDPLSPELSAGRRLFYTELDRRISRDGRACGACHPDGRDDGLVWKLGAGPRQTPTLLGRLDHGPYGWLGKHATLEGNMRETMTRLGGSGLSDSDLARLSLFVRTGLDTPSRGAADRAHDATLVARGRSIFTSESVGCSGCHVLSTDASDRSPHDVGSRGKHDVVSQFRTPPLLHIGTTAPYFHDGRYATLEQLLNDNLDRMGQTTQLSPSDIRALAAFLRTL